MPIFEVCTDSIQGVIAARDAGAHRVEVCSSLDDGGVTPSTGLIELACEVRIPVHVLVRPRAGNFVYSSLEMKVMLRDLEMVKNVGAAGAVIGVLERGGRLDLERTRELVVASRPMSVTFHRAFDVCNDPAGVLEQLIALRVDRVLTSGQAPTALEGAHLIQKLNHQARGRIVVMAGGGLRAHTVKRVLLETGATEIHFTARESLETQISSPLSFGTHRETTKTEIERVISSATD